MQASCRQIRFAPFLLGALTLAASLAACAGKLPSPAAATGVASWRTVQPNAAATLTAWPTPPPIITLPPTLTLAPQPLWTSAPLAASSLPGATAASGATSSLEAGAGLGARPRPVRLKIPSLSLDVPVVEVSWTLVSRDGTWQSQWQTAEFAAGHHRNTANPGEIGNMVISGHHNTRGEVFRRVSEIGQPGVAFGPGDDILVTAEDGQEYAYTVIKWDRFQEEGATPEQVKEHAGYLAPTPDATLTLVTCWPYESNTHRVVVVAKPKP